MERALALCITAILDDKDFIRVTVRKTAFPAAIDFLLVFS
jgi:hypothetical protein